MLVVLAYHLGFRLDLDLCLVDFGMMVRWLVILRSAKLHSGMDPSPQYKAAGLWWCAWGRQGCGVW
jgi:hypothetical protein